MSSLRGMCWTVVICVAGCLPEMPDSVCEGDADCRDTHACVEGVCRERTVAASSSSLGTASSTGSSGLSSSAMGPSSSSSLMEVSSSSSVMMGSSSQMGSSSSESGSSSTSMVASSSSSPSSSSAIPVGPLAPRLSTISDPRAPRAEITRDPADNVTTSFECAAGSMAFVACSSPWDVRLTPSLDALAVHSEVEVCVRAVGGGVASSPTCKPVRRGLMPRGLWPSDVYDLDVMPDGSVVAVGAFTRAMAEVTGRNVVRRRADGTIDTSLTGLVVGTDPGTRVNVLLNEIDRLNVPTGKVFVGGTFTTFEGDLGTKPFLVRLLPDGSVDPTFNMGGAGFTTNYEGVRALAQQLDPATGFPTGKLYVGGEFGLYNTSSIDNILRLNEGGDVDRTFNVGGTGTDRRVAVIVAEHSPVDGKPTGRILVGGSLTTYNGAAVPERLMRLDADGRRDTSFNMGGAGFDGDVRIVVEERTADHGYTGRLYVGGDFDRYNGVTARRLVRLNADGSHDMVFPGAQAFDSDSYEVNDVKQEVLADGRYGTRFYVAGSWDDIYDLRRRGLVRLTVDGMLDGTFNPNGGGADGTVFTVTQEIDGMGRPTGRLLVGGDFFAWEEATMVCRSSGFVILDDTGLCNTQYALFAINGTVRTALPAFDGGGTRLAALWFGGSFNGMLGVDVPDSVALLDVNGRPVASFTGAGTLGPLYAVALERMTGGALPTRFVLGGEFSTYNNRSNVPRGLLRVDLANAIDNGFNSMRTGVYGVINDVAQELDLEGNPSGRWYVAGSPGSYDGASTGGIFRVNANGTLDTSFDTGTGFDGSIARVIQERRPDGKPTGNLFVSGQFTTFDGMPVRNGVMKLTSTGARDTSFTLADGNAGGYGGVYAMLQEYTPAAGYGSRLIIGGSWPAFAGQDQNRLLRLKADGSIDATFLADNNNGTYYGSISALAYDVGPDGALTGLVLVGGELTMFQSTPVPQDLIRVTMDGALPVDDPFNDPARQGTDGEVEVIRTDTSQIATVGVRIVVGGSFSAVHGESRPGIARLFRDGSLDEDFAGQRR